MIWDIFITEFQNLNAIFGDGPYNVWLAVWIALLVALGVDGALDMLDSLYRFYIDF
jgi:hypothetical protein